MKGEQHRVRRRSTGDGEDERFDIFSFDREFVAYRCVLCGKYSIKNDKIEQKKKKRK